MTTNPAPLPSSLLDPPPGCPPELAFRLAETSDLEALYSACFADRTHGSFQRTMATILARQAAGRTFLVLAALRLRDPVVGTVQLHIHRHTGEIADLFVVPQHRRQGIATALMATILNLGHYLALETLEVGVEDDNEPAVRLYQRLGFVPDRSIKVPGQGLATIMIKELSK